jgi:hypothetical protein
MKRLVETARIAAAVALVVFVLAVLIHVCGWQFIAGVGVGGLAGFTICAILVVGARADAPD